MIKIIIIFYLCTPDRSNEKARSASSDERHQVVGIQYLIFWWWTGLLLEVRSPWLCWLWWWRSMWFQDTGQRTGNGFHFLAWKLFHFGWINLFLGQRNWLLCRWSAKEKEHDGDSRGDRCGSRLYPTRLLTGVGGGGGTTDLSRETLRRLDAEDVKMRKNPAKTFELFVIV